MVNELLKIIISYIIIMFISFVNGINIALNHIIEEMKKNK